jgi:ribonucleoside-diphosphate reductase beta chain
MIHQNKLFNPKGDDNKQSRTMIKGNATGLFNLNDVKYSWAKQMYQVMIGNFWVPEKVKGLGEDAIMYTDLSTHEQNAYDGVLSFLIFLDSVQTINLPNYSSIITAPEVNLLLSIQAYQEAIHSQSYATMLETIVDAKKRDEIYYFWRSDKILLERITYIGDLYQKFIDHPSESNFFTALIANYLLEGIYFYNGFAFFDTLVFKSKNDSQR